jgi:hypothetical protein
MFEILWKENEKVQFEYTNLLIEGIILYLQL